MENVFRRKLFLFLLLKIVYFLFVNSSDGKLLNHETRLLSFGSQKDGNDISILNELPIEKLMKVKKFVEDLKQTKIITPSDEKKLKDEITDGQIIRNENSDILNNKLQRTALALVDDQKFDR